MAISIITPPSLYSPVYNPIYTEVSSTLTSQEAFSFLFDLYVNGTFVTRDRLLPRPGTTRAIYSPARILESYVSYDLTQNITDNTDSINCIDKYDIRFGEEYITYWLFNDTQYDSFSASSYTVLSAATSSKHSFLVNDYIAVDSTVYGTYNGVHKVVAVPNDHTVIINKTFTSTALNPGRATWSDKRKTAYIGPYTNTIQNPTFLYLGGTGSGSGKNKWNKTLVPVCYNQFGIETFNRMIFDMNDNTCGSTMSVEYLGGTFIPGTDYIITFNVDTIVNPSGSTQSVLVNLGGNTTIPFSGTGSYTQTITCGSTGVLQLVGYFPANTSGFGYHAFTMNSISIIQSEVKFTGYDFNGVIQYEEVPEWDYNIFRMNNPNGKFLTKEPSILKTTLQDRGSIGFINVSELSTNESVFLVIGGYTTTGDLTIPIPLPLNLFGDLRYTNRRILEIPAYPWNINQMTQPIFGIDAIGIGNSSYNIQLYKYDSIADTYTEISEKKTFELDHCGTRFETVRFMFLNSLGQFDYYNATLLSRTTVSVSRDNYTKTLPLNYTQGDRGKTVINVNAQENYTITTDWVSEETAHWLTYEFLTSNEIYVLDNTTGKITPIILNVNDWEDKKRVNDKLLNYTITYSKAVTLNTRRN